MYVVRVGPQRMLDPIIRVGWNKTLHSRAVKVIPFSDSYTFKLTFDQRLIYSHGKNSKIAEEYIYGKISLQPSSIIPLPRNERYY